MTKTSATRVIPLVSLVLDVFIRVRVYLMGTIRSQAVSGLLTIFCVTKTGQLLTNIAIKGISTQRQEYVHQRLTKVSFVSHCVKMNPRYEGHWQYPDSFPGNRNRGKFLTAFFITDKLRKNI